MLLTCSVWTIAPLHSLWSVEYVRAFLILQYAIGVPPVLYLLVELEFIISYRHYNVNRQFSQTYNIDIVYTVY